MCTSSQSSTAARPDSSTIRLPIRKSPCTSRGGLDRRPVGGQPSKRPLERRRGVAHLVEPVAPLGQLLRLRQADPVRVGAVDGGQRLRALPQQPVASGIPVSTVEGSIYPSDDRLARDGIADEVRIAQRRRRIVGREDVRDGCPCGRRTLLDACLQLHARMHVVGWSGAQDQRLPTVVTDRVERPRGAAGPAGQGVEVLDAHLTDDRPKDLCQLFFHLRPKPKSRCATRRIWISSAPSVIR